LNSCKEKVTNPPDNQFPEGYQQDVPWPSLADSPWPMDHHDPQNTGRSKYEGPVIGNIDGVIDSVDIYNSISFGEDSTLFLSVGGSTNSSLKKQGLYAIRPSGQIKWIYNFSQTGRSYSTPLIAKDGTIYCSFVGYNNLKKFYAINPNGTLKWEVDNISVKMNGVTIGLDGTIYFIQSGGTGILTALSKDGIILWTYTDPKIYGGDNTGMSFSPDGKTLYLYTFIENKALAAFDIASRTIKWGFGYYVSGHPMVDCKGNLYVVANDSTLYEGSTAVVSLDDGGKIRWSYPVYSAMANLYTTPIMDKNGNTYCGFDTLYSFDYSGNLRWKKDICVECPDGGGNIISPIVSDKNSRIFFTIHYMGAPDIKEFVAYNNDGTILWKFSPSFRPESVYSPAIGFNKDLYIPNYEVPKILSIK